MSHLSPLLKQSSRIVAHKGEGCYIYDGDGRRWLDFTSGIGVTSTGHCHPKVVAAAQEQVASLIHGQYATVRHPKLLEISDRLAEMLPGRLDSVAFSNAGTEATEMAMRLARHATGRPTVIAFQGGFHGRTMGAASMTSSATKFRTGWAPLMAGVVFAPFPHAWRYGWSLDESVDFCLRELDNLFVSQTAPEDVACMIVEPVQGEIGYYPATTAFMQGLRERCDRHGILLISDEVQAGYGRTGKFWSYEHFGAEPDIIVTAKGLASGFPLSGIAASKSLMEKGVPGSQGGTYGANAVACAAATATLDVIQEEGLVANAAETGAYLREKLDGLCERLEFVGEVRGMGFMHGMEIVDDRGRPDGEMAARLLAASEDEGLLLLRCGSHGQVVRWLPPLIAGREHVDEAMAAFDKALTKV